MKTADERRASLGLKIKLHAGSHISIRHEDDKPIDLVVQAILPRGQYTHQIMCEDVAEGDYYSIVITR